MPWKVRQLIFKHIIAQRAINEVEALTSLYLAKSHGHSPDGPSTRLHPAPGLAGGSPSPGRQRTGLGGLPRPSCHCVSGSSIDTGEGPVGCRAQSGEGQRSGRRSEAGWRAPARVLSLTCCPEPQCPGPLGHRPAPGPGTHAANVLARAGGRGEPPPILECLLPSPRLPRAVLGSRSRGRASTPAYLWASVPPTWGSSPTFICCCHRPRQGRHSHYSSGGPGGQGGGRMGPSLASLPLRYTRCSLRRLCALLSLGGAGVPGKGV